MHLLTALSPNGQKLSRYCTNVSSTHSNSFLLCEFLIIFARSWLCLLIVNYTLKTTAVISSCCVPLLPLLPGRTPQKYTSPIYSKLHSWLLLIDLAPPLPRCNSVITR